jgi:protein HokE
MLTKYALVAIVVLCFTALGFTLMVRFVVRVKH